MFCDNKTEGKAELEKEENQLVRTQGREEREENE